MRFRLAPILALLVFLFLPSAGARAFDTSAKAAIIIDYRTGAVLFEKNADERIPPASMSKLMTAYMVFDQLKSGRLKLDDAVLVSERAWKMGGSQMFVEVGERVKVEDLIRGVIIQSGNDACVTLAEAIAGSEEEFARRMNEKAAELGLSGSSFANATGLDAPNHLMTVRDLATLAQRIITDFPEYFKYYSEREFEYAGIKQPNRNPLLQSGVPGVDGMKTGFTDGAGYGLVATAQRDDRRIITVMAGLETAGKNMGRPVEAYLLADPFVAAMTVLSTHTVYRGLLWSVGLLALTLVFGRVFCGWICPFGTLHHFFAWILPSPKLPMRW
mgnify:CR=1 FL=1